MAKKKIEHNYPKQKKTNPWLIIAIVEAVLLLLLIIVLVVPSKTGEAGSNTYTKCSCIDDYRYSCCDPKTGVCLEPVSCGENGCNNATGRCFGGFTRCFGRICFR